MTITLENVMIYIGIITAAVTLFRAVVVAPIRDALNTLKEAIDALRGVLAVHGERLAKVEASAASAHKRIDGIQGGRER